MVTAGSGRWGEQGDGTYHNPILPADYCDPDAIRVGDDFYAIASTQHLSPGITILHSRDLVNWTLVGHVIADVSVLSPRLNWDRMDAYGRGVWAPALRFHDGRFWLYVVTPDEGCFVCTATEPAGPWEPLTQMFAAAGWDDCCPFWDDDKGYLVLTHFADDYKIYVFDLTDDGRSIVHESGRVIHQGKGREASKLFKHNGMVYHFFSEVREEGRVPMIGRAPTVDGPYERRKLLHVNIPVDREPNQGALIEFADGRWYFLTHHGTGDWEGRPISLLPVEWRDGWPLIGNVGEDGIGTMVWSGKMPLPSVPVAVPTSDDFSSPTLGPQWLWNHQPRADMWSLTERPGALRLYAFRPLRAGDFFTVGNTICQRALRTPSNTMTVKLSIGGMTDGHAAGLCHFSATSSLFGIVQRGTTRTLVHTLNGSPTPIADMPHDTIWLRSEWGSDGISRYSYSLDGTHWATTQATYQLAWGHSRGDSCGIYSFNEQADAGFVDVEQVWYDYTSYRSAADG